MERGIITSLRIPVLRDVARIFREPLRVHDHGAGVKARGRQRDMARAASRHPSIGRRPHLQGRRPRATAVRDYSSAETQLSERPATAARTQWHIPRESRAARSGTIAANDSTQHQADHQVRMSADEPDGRRRQPHIRPEHVLKEPREFRDSPHRSRRENGRKRTVKGGGEPTYASDETSIQPARRGQSGFAHVHRQRPPATFKTLLSLSTRSFSEAEPRRLAPRPR